MDNIFIQSVKWLLKWIGIAIGSLIALALIGTAIALAWNWWSYDRHVAKIEVQASNDASNSAKRCTENFPIFVGFVNNSSKIVTHIQIHVTASLPEHSTNILSSFESVSMDDIVTQGHGSGYCYNLQISEGYRANPKAGKAVYKAEIYSVKFSQ